jgi:hypothetical protein
MLGSVLVSCKVNAHAQIGRSAVSASALYAHYSEWANRNGERPLNMKELKNKLVELFDMTHKRSRRGSDWVGVKLRI